MTERVPQHDPPPDSGLVQPEVDKRDDSLLVAGDDRDHVLPPTELEPYTPEAAPTPAARTALWIALAVAIVVIVVVLVVAFS